MILEVLQNAADAIPWSQVANGGSALVALVMCWLFLQHTTAMRKEHNATMERVCDEFSKTVAAAQSTGEKIQSKFADTTLMIVKDSREREASLQTLIRESLAAVVRPQHNPPV